MQYGGLVGFELAGGRGRGRARSAPRCRSSSAAPGRADIRRQRWRPRARRMTGYRSTFPSTAKKARGTTASAAMSACRACRATKTKAAYTYMTLQPDYGRGPIRMAESKSKWFALFINARDLKSDKFRASSSGIDRATIISVVAQDRRSRYDSPNLASRSRANPQKPANDMNAPSATSKHLTQGAHLRSV